MKIAKEGFIFLGPSAALCLLFLAVGWGLPGVLFLLLSAAFIFFFRDPNRSIPQEKGLIVSPADGQVVKIDQRAAHPWLDTPATCVSVFLALYNVHLTRSPIAGTVAETEYKPGRFFPAYRDEAGRENESRTLLIRGEDVSLVVKQIVGVAARRIKCFVKKDDSVERGQKMGLMFFGSRVDLYLPPSVSIKVGLKQKVRAGETIIGEIQK